MGKQVKWFHSFHRKFPRFFIVGLPGLFVATFLYPISQSGLSGDDIPNSMRSAALQANDWTRWEFINLAIKQWKTFEGRFFPVSTIENVYMFDFIHSVHLYKFLQFGITLLLLFLAAAFIAKLLGSWRILPLAVFILLSCLQTRNWYDPTLGFGLLLQSVQIKILFCLYGVVNFLQINGRRAYFYLLGSALLLVMALLQYEVVITLIPSVLFLLVLFQGDGLRKKIAGVLFVAIPAVYTWYVLQLRMGVSSSAAYSINSDLGTVALTYFKQLSGGIPFSAIIWSRGTESPITALSKLTFFLLLLLVVTIVLSLIFRSVLIKVPNRSSLILFVIGVNFCLGPAVTTALSIRWQNEVSWGLSYLSVSFVYTGIAFIFISVLIFALKALRGRTAHSAILFSLFAGIFALSTVSNHALLVSNVNATKYARDQRATYELAIRQGFFSNVPDNSVVVFPSFDENSWVNNYFTAWLGGPKGLTFVKTSEDALKKCDSSILFEPCPKSFYLNYITTNTTEIALSLNEINARTVNSQLSERYFGQHLRSEDLQTTCPELLKVKTKNGTLFSCKGE